MSVWAWVGVGYLAWLVVFFGWMLWEIRNAPLREDW